MELIQYKVGRTHWVKCLCDICATEYENKQCKEARRKNGKISFGRNLCAACVKKENIKLIVEAGTKALKSRSKEEIQKHAKIGGDASAKIENSGRFNSQRWELMSPEDQKTQVTRANNALQEKLNSDPEFKDSHWRKVFKQMKIGYISKAHQQIHESLSELGFETHIVISGMQVDECNEKLKIVLEYNGDFWHCNPEKWTSDQYNKTIKMTAGEKWTADLNRKRVLTKLGYEVLVIWESEWIKDKNKCLDRIKKKINEITIQKTNPA